MTGKRIAKKSPDYTTKAIDALDEFLRAHGRTATAYLLLRYAESRLPITRPTEADRRLAGIE